MKKIRDIFRLMRPVQYVKNVFIFMPLFFSGQIFHTSVLIDTFLSFVAFSLCASAIYILNDYRDMNEDRIHPKKKNRPLASGSVSPQTALILAIVLVIIGISMTMTLSWITLAVLGGYIASNTLYSLYLKYISILDVTIVSIGFVLRLFVGSTVAQIDLSMWIIIMTFLLALFIALAKRRDDVLILIQTGKKMRKSIDGYTLPLIDNIMMITASLVIMIYIVYTTNSETIVSHVQSENLYFTSLFVILGVMRYLQITFVEQDSGSPTSILVKDRFMQINLGIWFLSFAWILYG